MNEDAYSIGELAELGGVTRRTVRYYVQEGLIPPPFGLGRGAKYGREHLEQLLRVKALQERGLSLESVREALGGRDVEVDLTPRSHWTRLEMLPGVELHVSSQHALPSRAELKELADWCRDHFRHE